jgi:hypothetical protein
VTRGAGIDEIALPLSRQQASRRKRHEWIVFGTDQHCRDGNGASRNRAEPPDFARGAVALDVGGSYEKRATHFPPEPFAGETRPMRESHTPETVRDDNYVPGTIRDRLVKPVYPFPAIGRGPVSLLDPA